VFIALVDILPVLGTGTVMIPWAIIEMITGDVTMGLSIGVLYGVITLIRNIIEPKLVGYHIGLHPLVTLMAMFIGLSVMGVPGMFLFPITLIILKHMQDTGKIRIWKD
ncbi:MAG TPA: AI-2E family transporter, partial [Clostridia bacterium]|nr:AI-2E family transporter [Clostridia bacterium]